MPEKTKSIKLKEIWKETREWRRYWKTSNLFKAFLFSFVFSLFDMGTDFNFAWSVPSDCPTDHPPDVFTPCGMFHPKQVELFTYSFIGAPAIWVGSAVFINLLKQMILQCSGEHIHRKLSSSAGVFALMIQISVCNGAFFVTHPGNLNIQTWLKDSPTFSKCWPISLQPVSSE